MVIKRWVVLIISAILLFGCFSEGPSDEGVEGNKKEEIKIVGELERIKYNDDGELKEYRKTEYNSDKQIMTEKIYEKDGELIETRTFDYIDKKLKTQIIKNEDDEITEYREYIYDENTGNLVSKKVMEEEGGEIIEYYEFIYKDDRLYREDEYTSEEKEKLKNYIIYTYKDGKLDRETKYKESEEMKSYKKYTYDGDKILKLEKYDIKSSGEKLDDKYIYYYDQEDKNLKASILIVDVDKKEGTEEYEEIDEFSDLEIKVLNNENVEIPFLKSELIIYVDGKKISKGEFNNQKSGVYTYQLELNGVKSNEIKLTFQGTKPEEEVITYEELFSSNKLYEIEIKISRSEWKGIREDMLKNIKTGNYRKADFIFKGENKEILLENVGFRVRGNTTRIIPEDTEGNYHRAHFKVKFNKTFDMIEGTKEEEERSDRRFANLRALNFKWNMDNNDPSQIREIYQYNMLNKSGTNAPKTNSTKLTINIDGEKNYFGLYSIIEPVDKSFFTNRYGSDKNDGNLFKCLYQQYDKSGKWGPATLEKIVTDSYPDAIGVKDRENGYYPSYDLKTNEDELDVAKIELKEFIKNINEKSGVEFKSYMDANFEVDKFLRYQAMNMLLGMPDDYWSMGNNYYLYFGEKIEFIPYDYDHGLGGGWDGGVGYNAIKNADIYSWFNKAGGKRPLTEKIMEINEYKTKYIEYLKEFIDKYFIYSDYENFYNEMETLYSPYLDNDIDEGESMRHYGEKEYFEEKINSINMQIN